MKKKMIRYGWIPIILLLFLLKLVSFSNKPNFFLGGNLQVTKNDLNQTISQRKTRSCERFFRPSNQPILNTYELNSIINDYEDNSKSNKFTLKKELFLNPKEMILSYYSILREAYTLEKGFNAGCGSLGYGSTPYLITYQFLDKSYQKKISYKQYHKSFQNILHINLLKLILVEEKNSLQHYFIELETIEGTRNDAGGFQYYYGYITVKEENKSYKITGIKLFPEVYLCAPYHGWSYSAEEVTDIEYRQWCHLVKEQYPTVINDQIKTIEFETYKNELYVLKFVILSNDTDILIGQYRKDIYGNLIKIKIDPNKCINP